METELLVSKAIMIKELEPTTIQSLRLRCVVYSSFNYVSVVTAVGFIVGVSFAERKGAPT
jgi:type IV secretory pathway VirB9-like protein